MHSQGNKELIIFDLDGTLAESKSRIDEEMSDLFHTLLQKKRVAIIGGGSYNQFEKQLLSHISYPPRILSRLSLFPTSGARFYAYDNGWREMYAHNLSSREKQKIFDAFDTVFQELSYTHPQKIYGDVFEDRGTQITFSALGQDAPVSEKEFWNEHTDTRARIRSALMQHLSEFEVRLGGLTSVDVMRKGIDKGYGIRQIEIFLKIPKSEMLFIGDALYEGGNDYPAIREGIDTIAVVNPEDTKKIIRDLVS